MAVIIRSMCGNNAKGGQLTPGACTNIRAKTKMQGILLRWSDPEDISDANKLNLEWQGTRILRKENSIPQNESDGTLILDNKIRNGYSERDYLDENVANNINYYYRFFPYSKDGIYDYSGKNVVNVTKQGYRTLGCRIKSTLTSDMGTVEYTNDAVGMIPGSSEWDDFFGYYPCMFKNGEEKNLLSVSDFSKLSDGGIIDTVSGNAGDVMIAFPRTGLRIVTEGGYIYISMTDNPNDVDFDYYAHTRGSARREKFFLGAYINVELDGKLRSLSGQSKVSKEQYPNGVSGSRNRARKNGVGYGIMTFYQGLFIQAMYILKNKSIDAPLVKGKTVDVRKYSTGLTDKMGLNYEKTDEIPAFKTFGLEDLKGCYNAMECFYHNTAAPPGVYISKDPDLAGTSMECAISGALKSDDTYKGDCGYVTEFYGTSKLGFLPKRFSHPQKKPEFNYFDDFLTFKGGQVYLCPGNLAGIYINNVDTATMPNVRLMYL